MIVFVAVICDDDETKPLKRNRPVSAHNDDNDDIIPKADLVSWFSSFFV